VIDASVILPEYWFLQCPARATNTLLDVVKWDDNNDGMEKLSTGGHFGLANISAGAWVVCGTIQSKLEHQEKLTEKF